MNKINESVEQKKVIPLALPIRNDIDWIKAMYCESRLNATEKLRQHWQEKAINGVASAVWNWHPMDRVLRRDQNVQKWQDVRGFPLTVITEACAGRKIALPGNWFDGCEKARWERIFYAIEQDQAKPKQWPLGHWSCQMPGTLEILVESIIQNSTTIKRNTETGKDIQEELMCIAQAGILLGESQTLSKQEQERPWLTVQDEQGNPVTFSVQELRVLQGLRHEPHVEHRKERLKLKEIKEYPMLGLPKKVLHLVLQSLPNRHRWEDQLFDWIKEGVEQEQQWVRILFSRLESQEKNHSRIVGYIERFKDYLGLEGFEQLVNEYAVAGKCSSTAQKVLCEKWGVQYRAPKQVQWDKGWQEELCPLSLVTYDLLAQQEEQKRLNDFWSYTKDADLLLHLWKYEKKEPIHWVRVYGAENGRTYGYCNAWLQRLSSIGSLADTPVAKELVQVLIEQLEKNNMTILDFQFAKETGMNTTSIGKALEVKDVWGTAWTLSLSRMRTPSQRAVVESLVEGLTDQALRCGKSYEMVRAWTQQCVMEPLERLKFNKEEHDAFKEWLSVKNEQWALRETVVMKSPEQEQSQVPRVLRRKL